MHTHAIINEIGKSIVANQSELVSLKKQKCKSPENIIGQFNISDLRNKFDFTINMIKYQACKYSIAL